VIEPQVTRRERKEVWLRSLFLYRRYAMAAELTIGTVAYAGLFAHRFAANPVLAGLADTALQNRRRFGAHHAFFGYIGHFSYFALL
jgi:hypothetical protein